MSGRSITSRLQGLEERLRAEGHRQPPRPRLGPGTRARPRNRLELSSIPAAPVSQASIETDAKLKEIYKMSGLLTIGNEKYRSEITDLRHLGELGNGTCGHVVKMLHEPSGTVVAVKQMRRSGNSEENKRILMDLEVVLRSHDCPYIVRCLGYFITEADVWICMELMASCFDKILKRLNAPIPEEILKKITFATVSALSYLKDEHGVIHRDVKPSNILVDNRGVVKLCDFGISGRLVDSKAKTRGAGCAAYMAPERISPPDPQKPDYDIRADVWSLGITLVELATGIYPYSDCTNDFEVLSKVIEEEPPSLPENKTFSGEIISFVQQCLIKDYRLRPKYAALLEHPFVKQAAASGTCAGSWLTLALPPGSPRLEATPPVSRRKYQSNQQNDLQQDNNINLVSSSSQINIYNNDNINNQCILHDIAEKNNSKNDVMQKLTCLNVEESIDNKLATRQEQKTLSDKKISPSEDLLATSDSHNIVNDIDNSDNHFNNVPLWNPEPHRWPHKHIASSPNTRNYFANLEIKNQPFSGGGPSSFDNYTNLNRRQELIKTGPFGSPEIGRKQYFSPSRKRISSPYGYQESGFGSPTNFILLKNDGCELVTNNERSPPCFQTNAPTNYFASISKYPIPAVRCHGNLVYHQNPGGSCSQPASLEAYGEPKPGYSRTTEKNISPPLWSPQPAHRWIARQQEEKERENWRLPDHQHGNTSPIVLQRFYHQQGQRRSRRDWDSSSRQSSSSLSREASVGRSPEPPRRTHRDPSLPREHSSNQTPEHPLLREWRERERTPSKPTSHNDSIVDNDRHPDLVKSFHNERTFSPNYKMEREKLVNEANAQFELRVKMNSHHIHAREESNGECLKDNSGRKSNKDKSKESKNDHVLDYKDDSHLHHKHGKSHRDRDEQGWLNSIAGLVKRRFTSYVKLHLGANNHTGSSRSSSPGACAGGSVRATRLTPLPRRVAATDCGDVNKRIQDYSNNVIKSTGMPPTPPPRRTTDSWSLPASPLPTRPF